MAKIFVLIFYLICTCANAESFERYNKVTQYDHYFSKYSKRNFGPNFDWRYFKAQAIAESRLKKDAQSQVGAVGLMQIMPKTFKEIKHKNSAIKGRSREAKWNIAAGIYYDRAMWNLWKAKRPIQDKISFMFGSYNAGKGNILKAQKVAAKKGLNPNLWSSIEIALPKITKKHSRETINYIKKINIVKEVIKK